MSNKLYYRDKRTWITTRNTAIELFLLGLLMLILHLSTQQPSYEDMIHDTITNQSVQYVRGTHGTGSYELESIQGMRYIIWIQDAARDLDEKLKPGAQVEITYYTTTFPAYNHISEMYEGKIELVTYHDNRASDNLVCVIVTSIFEFLGAAFLWFGLWQRKNGHYTKEKTKELKERARLKK